DTEIASLKAALQVASLAFVEEPGPIAALRQENEELKVKVGELTQKILQAHDAPIERMTMLLQKLSGPSS
ncbi:hypothetical protein HAX54_026674, partial [Datura stramonium]|nr:hypothetical protein [Datura stramonium]